MSPSPNLLIPIQFLNAGNLVTAGLQLYRQHFKSYFRLSLLAAAWLYLPLIALALVILGVAVAIGGENSAAAIVLVLLVIAGFLGWLLFCIAKYQAMSAAIARLAFHDLLNAPHQVKEAIRYTSSRMWGFWLIGLSIGLIFAAVVTGLYVVLTIVIVIFAVVGGGATALQGASSPGDPAFIASMIAIFGFGILVAGIPAITFLLWLFSRLLISEVPHAIDPEITATGSLGRGWDLTDKSGWRIVTMMMVVITILFPLQFVQQTIGLLLQGVSVVADPEQSSGIFVIAILAGYAISLSINLLILPLWQSTKAVLYYDLRSRREGMGLELEPQDDALQPPPLMQLFNRVKLLTPESVELEFTLAGIGNRALALLIDYSILFLGWLIFLVVFSIFAYQLLQYLEQSNADYSNVPIWLLAIGFLLSFIFTTGYFAGFEVLRQGQTPGKRWAKIRVVRDDSRPVGLTQAVLRSLLQPIDNLLFVGAFMIFLSKREKRLGDWAAGTIVIQENRALKQAIVLSTEARKLATELPRTTDLAQLQPRHFAVVTEYLQRRPFLETKAKSDLSLDLARQIRTLIKLETLPQGLTADQFLEAVYLSYQQQFPGY